MTQKGRTMSIRTAQAVALAALALLTAGCGSSSTPQGGGTLRVVRAESFDGWVLDSAAAYGSYQTHAAVIEGLLRSGADGKSVEPGLAATWTHDAGARTWTFKLRPKARFSNGKPVTAADVVFALGVWKSGPNFGASFGNVKSASAADAQTVVFKLGSPHDNAFLPLIASSIAGVMPANFGGLGKKAYYKHPIGAGAFKVDSWTAGGRIVLSANASFYGAPARPRVNKVVIDVVADDNERANLLKAGQADVAEYVSPATTSQYDASALKTLVPSQIEHLSLNVKRAPFNDRAVRRAVAGAIDYASIIKGPYNGLAAPASGILAPNLANWAPPSKPYYATDLAAAKSLMANSSAPKGGATELIYDSGQATDALVAQIVKSNLARIGLDVKLTGLETGAFLDRAFGVDADMVLWSYGAISPDISDPLGWLVGTSWLFTGQKTDALSKQVDTYRAAVTTGQRAMVITQIQDQAIENADAIALAEFKITHAVSPKLSGFASAPWGLYPYDTIARNG